MSQISQDIQPVLQNTSQNMQENIQPQQQQLLEELFSSAYVDDEMFVDVLINQVQPGMSSTSGQLAPSGQQIQKSLGPEPKDGDGDGFVLDGSPQERPKKFVDRSYEVRADGTPVSPNEIDVYNVDPSSISADPAKFQYKIIGIGADGVTAELKETKVWNPVLGGVLLVWRDPESQQDYVVNGHHRLELARRAGAPVINVRYLTAENAKKARAIGALANVAEGRGTAVDAAKYLRDSDSSVDDLKKSGVSLTGKIAADSIILSRLSDKAFQSLANGNMDESKAVAVAKYLSDHELQNKLFKRMEAREEDGKEWTIKETETASRKMANAGRFVSQGVDLFGEYESEESTFDQEVEIETFVARALTQEMNDFRAVSSQRRADRVADTGNVLVVGQNELRSKSAEILLGSFERESVLRGEIADTIKRFAAELVAVKGKTQKTEVKNKALEEIKQQLLKMESRV